MREEQNFCDNCLFFILYLTLDPDHAEDDEEGEADAGPSRLVAPVPLAAGHPRALTLLPGPAPPVHILCLQRLDLKSIVSGIIFTIYD